MAVNSLEPPLEHYKTIIIFDFNAWAERVFIDVVGGDCPREVQTPRRPDDVKTSCGLSDYILRGNCVVVGPLVAVHERISFGWHEDCPRPDSC